MPYIELLTATDIALLTATDSDDEESTSASSIHSSDVPALVDPHLTRSTSFDSGNLGRRRPSYLLLRYEQGRIDKRRSRSAGGRIESSADSWP